MSDDLTLKIHLGLQSFQKHMDHLVCDINLFDSLLWHISTYDYKSFTRNVDVWLGYTANKHVNFGDNKRGIQLRLLYQITP